MMMEEKMDSDGESRPMMMDESEPMMAMEEPAFAQIKEEVAAPKAGRN
jgi:hypothetical protein